MRVRARHGAARRRPSSLAPTVIHDEPFVSRARRRRLGRGVGVGAVARGRRSTSSTRVAEAVELCNRLSPHFVASLISESADAHDRFFATIDAPFVGDGFTRWVDGQYALDTPELGLSNWEHGRMFGRGGDPVRRRCPHRPLSGPRRRRGDRTASSCDGVRQSQTPLMSTMRCTALSVYRHRSPSALSLTIAPLAVTCWSGVMFRFDASGRSPHG